MMNTLKMSYSMQYTETSNKLGVLHVMHVWWVVAVYVVGKEMVGTRLYRVWD